MTGTFVFIDSRVADYQTLVAGLAPDTQWALIDASRDGILQMMERLDGMINLDSIQIVSHGSVATLYLGSTILSSNNLDGYSAWLKQIGASLTATGDLLLYGCNVGAGETGTAFINALALATGADVAASDDLTGIGGDGQLETTHGFVEIAPLDFDGYTSTLNTIPGNASSTQTLTIGSSFASAIDSLGDADWYKVYFTHGYQYQIWIEGSGSGNGTLLDPYLAIYNASGVFQHGSNDYSIFTYDAYVTSIPNGSGYFFISAEEYGNNATGTYTVTIWQDELASTASAATVSVNGSVTGRIGWQGDISDWHAVTLTAGVLYQFDLVGSSGDGSSSGLTLSDPMLWLRNSDGLAVVSSDDDGLGMNSRIFFTPTTSGTYYLDAQESGNSDYGIYRLQVNSNPVAGNLAQGVPISGSVDFLGDADLYSVSLVAGVTYALSLDGNTLSNPFLEVLDSSGFVASSDDDSGAGLNSLITYTPTNSGTYYLAARASGNNATGGYSARVWQLPSISITDAFATEGNSGTTNLTFTLTLSTASPIDVSVSAATSGTATATYSADYTAASGTIIFAAGQTSAIFTVQVIGDSTFEPTESFHVLLSNPAGALLGDSNAYGLIVDNDAPYSLPADSQTGFQWYLYPTTGINAFPVWNDYTGEGVQVAVFDQGIDSSHSDLDGNLITSFGRNASNLSVGGGPVSSSDNHGTMVAGIIAAERNGSGIVGVAYGADLVSIYSPLTLSGMPGSIPNAYAYAGNFDVLNDSWGFANGFSSGTTWSFYDNFQNSTFAASGTALANLAATGRNGLGTVVVQSAGNCFGLGDDTNLHNFQNSQYPESVCNCHKSITTC